MPSWSVLVETRARRIALMAAAILLLLVIISFWLPAKWRVQRDVVIAAPPATVFPYINDLKKWREWTVWYASRPDMPVEYSARTEGVGATSRWIEADRRGALKIMGSSPNALVEYTLIFDGDAWVVYGSLRLVATPGGGTHVIWRSGGETGANPLLRYGALLARFLVGRDFDQSLEKLKVLVEAKDKPSP